jgi:uncharacterized RDD family membrane protein YckC
VEQFWVIRGQERSGPFSEAEILRAYRDGELKSTDRLWAQGVPTPVTVAEAFTQMREQGPAREIDLTLVELDEPAGAEAADESPYRPPLAAVEDRDDSDVRYAGFWVRYSANVLDSIILVAFALVLGFALGLLTSSLGMGALSAEWIGFAITLVLTWLYIVLGESSPASATWGKRAFHLQVLGADHFDRISFLRATGRLLGRYLSTLLFMIGYLIQPFNARRRALHDFLSGTVVVVQRQYSRLLIALMLVLSLVLPAGIIVAVAVPAYQQYVVRAKVSTALRQVTPATVAIQRYLAAQGRSPASLDEAGFDTRRGLAGVRRLAFDAASGVITVTFDFAPVDGSTVLIVPDQIENDAISWSCQPGTLPARWLPRQCPPGA